MDVTVTTAGGTGTGAGIYTYVVTAPTVGSPTSSNVTKTTATLRGTVTADGGAAISEHGVAYSTQQGFSISDPGVVKAMAAGTLGAFTVPVSMLAPGTTYYFVAYATNSAGTGTSAPASFTTVATAPEIAISGNSVEIVSGDTTPSASDDTVFGTVAVGQVSPDHVFTIANSGDAALNLTGTPVVKVTGANAGDFSLVASPQSPAAAGGGTATFSLRFVPQSPGLRTATVTVENNDSDEGSYTFAVSGYGSITPGVAVALSLGTDNQMLEFDPAGVSQTAASMAPKQGRKLMRISHAYPVLIIQSKSPRILATNRIGTE